MSIPVGDSSADKSEIFKIVWRGWFFGTLVIFPPFFGLGALAALLGAGGESRWEIVSSVFLIPLIAAFQAIIAGGLVVLGLSVSPPKKSH